MNNKRAVGQVAVAGLCGHGPAIDRIQGGEVAGLHGRGGVTEAGAPRRRVDTGLALQHRASARVPQQTQAVALLVVAVGAGVEDRVVAWPAYVRALQRKTIVGALVDE